jgi:hypothetical protein
MPNQKLAYCLEPRTKCPGFLFEGFGFWPSALLISPMRKIALPVAGVILLSLLAGCGGNPAEARFKHHPGDFMRQLVACESHFAAIGHTARCRQALRVNTRLFGE